MTALISAGGILVAFMMIAGLAARELFVNGAASERAKQAAATIAAVQVAKEVSDDVGKMPDPGLYAGLSGWMRSPER